MEFFKSNTKIPFMRQRLAAAIFFGNSFSSLGNFLSSIWFELWARFYGWNSNGGEFFSIG